LGNGKVRKVFEPEGFGILTCMDAQMSREHRYVRSDIPLRQSNKKGPYGPFLFDL